MDMIIYLSLGRKENAGGVKDAPPVFTIREKIQGVEDSEYRLLYVDIPRAMLKEPQAQKDGAEGLREKILGMLDRIAAMRGKAGEQTRSSQMHAGRSGELVRGPEKQTGRSGERIRNSEKKTGSPGEQTSHPEWHAEYEAECREIKRQQALRANLPWIRELSEYLVPFQLQSPACGMVYDESVDKWLKIHDLWGWWEKNWPVPALEDYHDAVFARRLMEQVHLSHFLVLGYAHCVPQLLTGQARRMKSLRFLLKKEPEGLEEFIEDFYEEHGLAASVRVVEGNSFKGERIVCAQPTAILDFSGESRILTADIVRGSVWLDMDSLEEKRRRIEDRNTGIYYFSMKKEWKRIKSGEKPGRDTI